MNKTKIKYETKQTEAKATTKIHEKNSITEMIANRIRKMEIDEKKRRECLKLLVLIIERGEALR